MTNFGEAFRIIRTVKKIAPKQAAADLECDEKTIRDIESGKVGVVSKRFQQLCDYYKVEPELVLALASGKTSFQNIIYDAHHNDTVINGQKAEDDVQKKYISLLEKQLESLQIRVAELEARRSSN